MRNGQRLTGMTSTQEQLSTGRREVSFRPPWPKRRLGQRAVAAHLGRRRRSVLHQVDAHRGDQPRSRPSPFCQTGAQLAGRPSIGSWLAYGLGSENAESAGVRGDDLAGHRQPTDQPLYDRLWGSGFLPHAIRACKFRAIGDPVLYSVEPAGRRRPPRAGGCSTTCPS